MAAPSLKRPTRNSQSSSHKAKTAEISFWHLRMVRLAPPTNKSVSFLVGVENSKRGWSWIVVESSERLFSCLKHCTRDRLKPFFLIKIYEYRALVASNCPTRKRSWAPKQKKHTGLPCPQSPSNFIGGTHAGSGIVRVRYSQTFKRQYVVTFTLNLPPLNQRLWDAVTSCKIWRHFTFVWSS